MTQRGMESFRCTPAGPWHVDEIDGKKYIYAHQMMLASMATFAKPQDAELMAAAPKLLNALKRIARANTVTFHEAIDAALLLLQELDSVGL